jgi:hypothetical protein
MRCDLGLPGACALVLLASSCAVDDGALAQVGDHSVTLEAFQTHLAAATDGPWEAVTDAVASRLLDQFLDQEVVIASAGRGIGSDLPLDPGARSGRVRVLLDDICGAPPPPEAEAIDRGVAEAQSVERPARAHVRQMLLDSLEEAEAAREQLDAGVDFVDLSRRVSRAPNAEGGGELGFLTEGGLSEEIDRVIFGLGSGEISEPVPGPSGYHIFQVLEVVPAGPPPRSEVEPEVIRELAEAMAREHAEDCVRRAAREVGVRVIHERLWFRYQGRYAEEIDAQS